MRHRWLFVAALAWTACSSDLVLPTNPGMAEEAVLIGAGDIGVCGSPNTAATARLLDGLPGTVFAAGDLAYPDGTAEQFADCYHPTRGRNRTGGNSLRWEAGSPIQEPDSVTEIRIVHSPSSIVTEASGGSLWRSQLMLRRS
ncbi:MAG: hypothetical protein EXQ48_05120 [Acidobacteria bacterium]|nr:hypothetical protein [Acidobacteriota bacterium]